MKIYTKKGDNGNTSLFGGQTVSKKSALRIESYGTVDELNSILGVVRSFNVSKSVDEWLNKVQHQLFVLGADLATSQNNNTRIDRISQDEIDFLEITIDQMDEELTSQKFHTTWGNISSCIHSPCSHCVPPGRTVNRCMCYGSGAL